MKVMMINGSPNEKGCTYTALLQCKKGLEEMGVDANIVHIGREPVYSCSACFGCEETGRCVHDDICNNMLALAEQSVGIIVGSPVYFAGPTGAICSLLERMFFANSDVLKGKPAAAVVSCRRSGSTAAFDRLNKFFAYNNMSIVTSQNCWNGVHGITPDEVMQDAEGMQTMRILGRNMAWLIKTMHGSNIKMPSEEEYIETSFIRD
ncbi:flavodoxin family protein [Anaerovorax odorimutans]|nr:flavodoxin family protein [Anaerovorax odorimutans]